MKSLMRFLVAFGALLNVVAAQTPGTPHRYMSHAALHRSDSHVAVTANYPRPLERVVTALRNEYGWIIDYEDPPYQSSKDLFDDTDPNWRRSHPSAKGVRGIAGGAFASEFEEQEDMSNGSEGETHALDKVVADYNASGNPGGFQIRHLGGGRLVVTGIRLRHNDGSSYNVLPVLDTPISISPVNQTTADAVHAVLEALSQATNYRFIIGDMPNNELLQASTTVGATNEAARTVLLKVLASTRHAVTWKLLYDPDFGYVLNLATATKLGEDSFGHPLRVPLANPQKQ